MTDAIQPPTRQTLSITAIPALGDNYIWLLSDGLQAVCIDPGDAEPVLDYLGQTKTELTQIWITHHHHDHTGGIAGLKSRFPDCEIYGNRDIAAATHPISEGAHLNFGGCRAEVWQVPGHTDTHLAYLFEYGGRLHVFCGDTLFSAGCGRVFTGTAADLATSFDRFKALPDDTLFYPAHEYTAANLVFAAHIEPDNPAIHAAAEAAHRTPTLPVSLAHEKAVNPFLRTDNPAVRRRTAELAGRAVSSNQETFAVLRELKNNF